MATVGFIGTGEIASAMVHGLTGHGHTILVSERNASISNVLSDFGDVNIASNQGVLDACDIVVLCLMKDVAHGVLPDLNFRKNHRVISVMVDVSFDALRGLCMPANQIEITIPLPPISVGGCPLPCYPADAIVNELFGAKNHVFTISSEVGLNAHFAATAMASSTLAQVGAGAKWLGDVTGDHEAAEAYLVSMLGGFLIGLPQDGKGRVAEALTALSTEGGLNATLRQHMSGRGVLNDLTDGLDGFRSRLGLPEKD
jgi:pyrroline-5-carboxylate reductase